MENRVALVYRLRECNLKQGPILLLKNFFFSKGHHYSERGTIIQNWGDTPLPPPGGAGLQRWNEKENPN